MDNKYLIALLRAAVNDTTPDKPEKNMDWQALYRLADKHSVTAAAWYAISKLSKEDLPQEIEQAKFKKSMQIALGIESMQHYEISGVMKAFENNGIQYVPLKGWVLKELYPIPYIRTMCDVDILVNDYDIPKVEPVLSKLGFVKEGNGVNHDGYIKSGNIATEIHWDLFIQDSPYHEFFSDIMKRTVSDGKDTTKRHMTKEDFFLHMVAHIAKHFNSAGTGMRSFMDIYLYVARYGGSLDRDCVKQGLDALGLCKFAKVICDAAYVWFSDKENENRDKYNELADYILYTGTYGNKDASIISGIQKNDGNKFKYIMRRFFPKKTSMEWGFPILKKRPYLLPFCYVIRGFKCILFRRDVMRTEFRKVKEADENNIKSVEEIKRMCGLN